MASIDLRSREWVRAAVVALVLAVLAAACSREAIFGKAYEYEEDLFVSLDGSAELTVNASVPALVALRGLSFPHERDARVEREQVRAVYESPFAEVRGVSRPWRRQGRTFVQVRLRIPDIRKLSQVAPFSWSAYELGEKDGQVVYKQNVAASALKPGTLQNVGWTGGELVAFRLHLPSKILWHNARDIETNETSDISRGNILAWEQLLTDRLDGRPIAIEVRMDRQSILNRTLWLFFGAFGMAVLAIGVILWLTKRRGAREAEAA